MNKHLYLIRNANQQTPAIFRQRLFEQVVPLLLAENPARLKLSVTVSPVPKLTVLPLQKSGLALISVWHEDDRASMPDWTRGLEAAGGQVFGYRVAESTPRAYTKSWADGDTSPGVTVLTLMKQHPRLSYTEFMDEWHGRHTPMALRIHPLWNYIRNVIEEPAVPGSPAFDGIVEEHFRSRADALNPVRMFGGTRKCLPHMLEVFRHVNSFLDLKRCENYLMTETHIRS